MSDVSAVVLSIGEPYTERALASIARQVVPAAEVVVVRDVSPMHRALNTGAARVRTPFFIQVDADMVLDPICIRDLRACVDSGVGIVVGHLRDPVFGRTVGIKLFRTACFAQAQFTDSISPDTDFVNGIERRGWTTVYALNYRGEGGADRHSFGEHRPDYTPLYTFSKYRLIGARARYRRAAGGIRGVFRQLQHIEHQCAEIATIAAAHGIFLRAEHDLLVPYEPSAEFARLHAFLSGSSTPASAAPPPAADLVGDDFSGTFRRAFHAGVRLHQQGAAAAFRHGLHTLQGQRATAAWVGVVALCHGLFADAYTDRAADDAFDWMRVLLPE